MKPMQVTLDQETTVLEIGSPGVPMDRLVLKLSIAADTLVYLWVYSPEGVYLGGIHTMPTNLPPALVLGASQWSLNGACRPLSGGKFRVVVQRFEPVSAVLTYAVDGAGDAMVAALPPHFLKKAPPVAPPIKPAVFQFYKGDFHGHTVFSDGEMNDLEAADALRVQGLDFMALTEHNAMRLEPLEAPCPIIPSFELTLSTGHFNIHGVKKQPLTMPKALLEGGTSLVNACLRTYREGTFITVNHPFMAPWHCTEQALDMALVDALEVICDPTYPSAPEANDRAVAFLDFLWQKGLRLFGVGGSDCHQKPTARYEGAQLPSVYGDPSTTVYSASAQPEALLASALSGHMYVARFVSLSLDIDGGLLPGEQFDPGEGRLLTYAVTLNWPTFFADVPLWPLLARGKCQFILNGEVVSSEPLCEDQTHVYRFETAVSRGADMWLRFGIVDGEGHELVYVNPVYTVGEHGKRQTFGNYLEEFKRRYD
ncbi:CehA/McbA family metallohydrolase [Fusibacter sp. JL298sf-3]